MILTAQNPTLNWAKKIGGNINDVGNSIATDAYGNIYTTGIFTGTVDFDPNIGVYNLVSISGSEDVFVSKIDVNGNFIWAKRMGGSSDDTGYSIAVDDSGNVYTTGDFFGTNIDFNPGSGVYYLSSGGALDIFIQKLDKNGNFCWAKQLSSTNPDQSFSITLDDFSNLYITGYFDQTMDFDPSINSFNLNPINGEIYILKLDTAGTFKWAKQLGGTSNRTNSIQVDKNGYIYLTGDFTAGGDFDPSINTFSLTPVGNEDVFIVKLDSNGVLKWAKQIGGSSRDIGTGIAVDSLSNVFLTGTFISPTINFDTISFTKSGGSNTYSDYFVTKLDSLGNYLWIKIFGSIEDDEANSICLDKFGNLYITGRFRTTVDFDPSSSLFNLSAGNNSAIYIQKLDNNGSFIWAGQMGYGTSWNYNSGNSILVDKNSNILTTGSFVSTVDFDPNVGVVNLVGSGGYDIFIHKLNQGITVSLNNYTSIIGYTLYPNPSKGQFSVVMDMLNEKTNLKVYNLIGEIIYEQEISSSTTEIDLNLKAGMYLIYITDKNSSSINKIIIE
jgi:hypothetical protein